MADTILQGTLGGVQATTEKKYDAKRRRVIMDMLASGEDPNFVRYNHVRHGFDEDEVNDAISTFQRISGKASQEQDVLEVNQTNLADTQRQSLGYGKRMLRSGEIIKGLESGIAEKGLLGSLGQVAEEKLVGTTVGNRAVSPEFQSFDQAKRDFVNAVLRRESGAVISPEEFKNAEKQYFPKPGDDPKTLEQKRQNRELVTKNFLSQAGVNAEDLSSLNKLLQEDIEGKTTQKIKTQDDLAYEWLQSNPNDPRAEQVQEKLDSLGYTPPTQEKTQETTPQIDGERKSLLNITGQPGEEKPLAKKIGDFLGISKFGEGIGTAMFLKTADGKKLQDDAAKGDQYAIEALNQILEDAPSAKELIGSATMTALNLASAGIAGRATMVGKVAQGAATGYGFDVASNLQGEKGIKESFKPGIGTAVGATLPVVGAGFKLGARAVKNLSSYLSGVPKEAIEEAFKNPEGVSKAINTFVKNDDAKMEIVSKAKNGLSGIIKKRGQAYEAALKEAQKTGNVGNLDIGTVKNKIGKTLQNFDIGFNGKNFDFTNTPIPKSQQGELKEVVGRINSWKDTSPIGMNKLSKIIDSYKVGSAESKSFDAIVKTLKSSVADMVSEASPIIAKMNSDYRKESELIEQLVSELSLGEGKSVSTSLNKLTSIFNRNGEFKEKLVRQLSGESGQQLLDDIVGSMFTEWVPRGLSSRIISSLGGATLAGAGFATSGATLPALLTGGAMASPRAIGGVTTLLGKASKKLPTEKVRSLTKTAILNMATEKKRKNR